MNGFTTMRNLKERKEKAMSQQNRMSEMEVLDKDSRDKAELEFTIGVGMQVVDHLMYKLEHLQSVLYTENLMPNGFAQWVNMAISDGAMWLGEAHNLSNGRGEESYHRALARCNERYENV